MALLLEQRPQQDDIRWNVSDRPIIIKASNTKFPTNTDDSSITAASIQNVDGLLQITTSSAHGFNRNDFIRFEGAVLDTEVYKIVRVPSTTTFIINIVYQNIPSSTAGDYVFRKFYKDYHNKLTLTINGKTIQVSAYPDVNNISTFDIMDFVRSEISSLHFDFIDYLVDAGVSSTLSVTSTRSTVSNWNVNDKNDKTVLSPSTGNFEDYIVQQSGTYRITIGGDFTNPGSTSSLNIDAFVNGTIDTSILSAALVNGITTAEQFADVELSEGDVVDFRAIFASASTLDWSNATLNIVRLQQQVEEDKSKFIPFTYTVLEAYRQADSDGNISIFESAAVSDTDTYYAALAYAKLGESTIMINRTLIDTGVTNKLSLHSQINQTIFSGYYFDVSIALQDYTLPTNGATLYPRYRVDGGSWVTFTFPDSGDLSGVYRLRLDNLGASESVEVALRNNAGSTERILINATVNNDCANQNLYLGWLNKYGGIDYHLFKTRKSYGFNTTAKKANRYIEDNANAKFKEYQFYKKFRDSRTLTADVTTTIEDSERLAYISKSPLVYEVNPDGTIKNLVLVEGGQPRFWEEQQKVKFDLQFTIQDSAEEEVQRL